MPATIFNVTGGATRALVRASQEVSPGRLRGISADILEGGSEPAQNYIRVLIEGQNAGESDSRHLILQGYIGLEAGLSWTGDFPLEDDVQITAEIMSSVSATAKISIATDPK